MLFVEVLFRSQTVLVCSIATGAPIQIHFRIRFQDIQTYVGDSNLDFGFFIHSPWPHNSFGVNICRRVVFYFFEPSHRRYFQNLFTSGVRDPARWGWILPEHIDVRMRTLGPNFYEEGHHYEPDTSLRSPTCWADVDWTSPSRLRTFYPFFNCQNYVLSRPPAELIEWLQDPNVRRYFRDGAPGQGQRVLEDHDNDVVRSNPIDTAIEVWCSTRGVLDHPDFAHISH
jgi:hypothetical protein